MPATDSIEPTEYTGQSLHGVDESRRLMVPSRWRPQDPKFKFRIILWPIGGEQYLMVLPPERWRELLTRLNAMSLSDEDAAALERVIGGTSAGVTLDKVGRICLPEDMAGAVAIEKEALLVGRLNKFEIWNPERYATVRASDKKVAAAAFKLKNL